MTAAAPPDAAPETSGGERVWEPPSGPGRRRLWWLIAAVVVVALVVVADGGDLAVTSAPEEGLAVVRGGEAALPEAPGRHDAVAQWRPPAPGAWSVLPPAPIGARTGHVVADLSGAVVVWGGWQQGRPLRNGALLDTTTGAWTAIPDSPVVQRRHLPVVAGQMLLLLDDEQPQGFSRYDRRWRLLEPPPLPPGGRLTSVTAWTGRAAVVATSLADGSAGPLLAWDVLRESWRRLDPPPGRISDDMAMVWDGRGLLLLGEGDAGFGRRLRLHRGLAPAAGATWEPVPPPPVPAPELATAGVRAVRGGSQLGDPVYVWLVPRPDGPAAGARLLAYRTAASDDSPGTWSALPAPPLPLHSPELVVVGEDLLALDPSGVLRYRPGSRIVQELAEPEVAPLQQRDAAASRGAVVWWGGGSGDGAVWRPEAPGPVDVAGVR